MDFKFVVGFVRSFIMIFPADKKLCNMNSREKLKHFIELIILKYQDCLVNLLKMRYIPYGWTGLVGSVVWWILMGLTAPGWLPGATCVRSWNDILILYLTFIEFYIRFFNLEFVDLLILWSIINNTRITYY